MSGMTSQKHIDKLRAEHQAQAKLAAESGRTPKAFLGDPTFEELVAASSSCPTPEIGSGMLAEIENDKASSKANVLAEIKNGRAASNSS